HTKAVYSLEGEPFFLDDKLLRNVCLTHSLVCYKPKKDKKETHFAILDPQLLGKGNYSLVYSSQTTLVLGENEIKLKPKIKGKQRALKLTRAPRGLTYMDMNITSSTQQECSFFQR